jgi:hypothetical protein
VRFDRCGRRAPRYRSAAAFLTLLFQLADGSSAAAAELSSRTSLAYDEYVRKAQDTFLARVRSDAPPPPQTDGIPPARPGREDGIISIPGGLVHHWVGGAFIPHATLERALDVAVAYDRFAGIYNEVLAAKLLARHDDAYQALIRIKESAGGVGAVLDITSTARYFHPTDRLVYSLTSSDQIREVENAGKPNERLLPAGHDSGYLWRTNSFTKFTEHDGGVFVEMETLGLSRRFPPFLGWVIEPIARRRGRKSIERSLEEFIAAVRKEGGSVAARSASAGAAGRRAPAGSR